MAKNLCSEWNLDAFNVWDINYIYALTLLSTDKMVQEYKDHEQKQQMLKNKQR